MARVTDFRLHAFQLGRVESAGKFLGRSAYWKLYVIENAVRVLIHSVLSAQLGSNWWATAVDTNIKSKAQRFRQAYLQRPWHTDPGSHDIYLIFLSDLNEIVRANSNQFLPSIPDIDQWVAKIEQVRIPRNVVGHMNFLQKIDRDRIDVLYSDILALIAKVKADGKLTLAIP